MRCRVHLLRHQGRRLRWRDVLNREATVGELLTHIRLNRQGVPVRVATLCAAHAPAQAPLLPDLYEPVLVLVGPGGLRLRGIERWEAGGAERAVVQEWQCEVLAGTAATGPTGRCSPDPEPPGGEGVRNHTRS